MEKRGGVVGAEGLGRGGVAWGGVSDRLGGREKYSTLIMLTTATTALTHTQWQLWRCDCC